MGRAVQRLRESSGLTQAELADRLNEIGWGPRQQSAIANLERGKRRINLEDLCLIASVFDVPPQALLYSASSDPVRVGRMDLEADEWRALMRVTKEDREALYSALHKSIPSKSHRRSGRLIRKVVLAGREKELAERSKYSGPTYVADIRTSVYVPLPSFGVKDRIDLNPGDPHVARDRLEAEALLAASEEGRIRRIDRHEARRLRRAMSRKENRRE